MSLVNHVSIIGNLGKDPEIRYTASGMAVANLSVATNEKRGNTNHTEWHRVIMFGKLAEIAGKIYKKGKQVALEGRIQTRQWIDKDKVTRWTTEIVADFAKLMGPAPVVANGPPVEDYDQAEPQLTPAQKGAATRKANKAAAAKKKAAAYKSEINPSQSQIDDDNSEIPF